MYRFFVLPLFLLLSINIGCQNDAHHLHFVAMFYGQLGPFFAINLGFSLFSVLTVPVCM